MNRIEERLNKLKEKNEKALITYMTAGLPNMEKTKQIIKLQEKSGTDIIELGIPFSDPIADGPVIQEASYKSLLNGTNINQIFEAVKDVRIYCQIPIIFMLYYNTVVHYGLQNFIDKCIEVGVDGLIIPDLPFEEQNEIQDILNKQAGPILIQLVSPVSKNRIPMILKHAKGFVYCVSALGVTGQNGKFYDEIKEYLKYVKENSKIPIMMGFGIRTADDIKDVIDIVDGAIVGTHFIKLMEEKDYNAEVIQNYITGFKKRLSEGRGIRQLLIT